MWAFIKIKIDKTSCEFKLDEAKITHVLVMYGNIRSTLRIGFDLQCDLCLGFLSL